MGMMSTIKPIGNVVFYGKGLTLGTKEFTSKYTDEKRREMRKEDYPGAPQTMPPWFKANEMNKYHQEASDKIGKDFKEFHDSMCDAIEFAHKMWKAKAKFKDLKVNAVACLGTPGCLDGPELENDIKNAPMCSSWSGNKQKYRDAVAKGVSTCYKNWQDKVTVPGFPWYPAFAAFPAPMAPPMPNIPLPLIACVSAKVADVITPDQMKKEMIDALDGGIKNKDKDKQHEALFEAIATVASLGFVIWMASQMTMLVLGKGPVPSFAPPFVPVGPVVMGDNTGAGNCMA